MGTLQTWRKAYGAIKDSTMVGLAKVNSEYKDLDVAIVKATNHVECPPKERHVRKIFLATTTSRPRADIAYCIYALARRLSKTHNWTVALKTLIVFHRLLREGDPSFKDELLSYSSRGNILQIANFKDDSSALGFLYQVAIVVQPLWNWDYQLVRIVHTQSWSLEPANTLKNEESEIKYNKVSTTIPEHVYLVGEPAWDCSAWVRTYALFIEERLECYRVLKYDIEAERLIRSPQSTSTKGHSRTRTLPSVDLLEQLPALQQLLFRLIGCQPDGGACTNFLVQYALALILKESFKIYCAVNDGIINLVDMFFEMPKFDAIKALDIYKRAGQQAENLSDFYEFCKHLELARTFQFPTLRQPPPSFLATMEEYIREAPRDGSTKQLEYPETYLLTYNQEGEGTPQEGEEPVQEEKEEVPEEPELEAEPPEPEPEPQPEPEPATTGDLLGLDQEINPVATELEQSNALALAIISPEDAAKPSTSRDLFDASASGWELALVTAPSSNTSRPVETKLGGGFDKLLLDSLYEDEARRQQIAGGTYAGSASANPFETQDPFAMSSGIAPPSNVQMSMLALQQQQYYQQQYYQHQQYYNNYQPYQQQQQMMIVPQGYQHHNTSPQVGSGNPFGDPLVGSATQHPSLGNSSSLL